MDVVKDINKLVSLSVIGDYFSERNIDIRSFDYGCDGINFIDEGKFYFNNLMLKLYEEDIEINSSYTLQKYESCFISCFAENFRKKENINKEEYIYFKKKLKAKKVISYSVIRGIFGISISNIEDPIQLGLYTIYNFEKHKHLLEKKSCSIPEHLWFGDEPEYLIEWNSSARHPEKALEIADERFQKFELIMNYVIGYPSERIEVAIFDYQGWRNRQAYVLSKDTTTRSGSNHGAFQPVPIDLEYFNSADQGYRQLWDLSCGNNLNKFQKRILLSAEWIGQAIEDSSPQSSFLKVAISLEILFTYNEKTIINPSILNQLSESVALIIGINMQERLELESKLKKLYALRSAIVHSGKSDIHEVQRNELLNIARAVVKSLLTEKEYNNIKTIDELYLLLKKIKYSGNLTSASRKGLANSVVELI